MKITVSTPIQETCRVAQIHGMFDLPNEKISTREWNIELSLSERPWNISLIVGPSGSGKTTIAKSQWGDYLHLDSPV